MNIPEDIIRKGSVTIFNDTDDALTNDIKSYNDLMSECRIKKKRMEEIRFGFFILNPLVICAMIAAESASFINGIIPILLLAAYIILLIIFVVLKQNLIIGTAAEILLVFVDLRFAIVLAADIIMTFIFERIRRKLMHQPGYPVFSDIRITYERRNTPDPELMKRY